MARTRRTSRNRTKRANSVDRAYRKLAGHERYDLSGGVGKAYRKLAGHEKQNPRQLKKAYERLAGHNEGVSTVYEAIVGPSRRRKARA